MPPPNNSFITPQIVAREALRLLQSNILTPHLMSRKYEADFSQSGQKVGDTINIRRRVKGAIQEFNGSNGNTQIDLVESQIPMTLEKHFDAGISVSAKDYTLELEVFSEQIIQPYITEMAEQVDIYGLSKLLHIPNFAGLSSAVPIATLPDSITAMAEVDKTANLLKMPTLPRYQIISPEYKATLLGVPSFVEVDKSGETSALRLAHFNTIMGFKSFMGQNVPTQTTTSGSQTGFQTAGATVVGATSISADTPSVVSGTLVAGDVFNIPGYGNVTVSANTQFAAGTATIQLQEPIRNTGAGTTAIASGAVCTVYDGGINDRQCHGAIFHPDCMAFASVPLALPKSVPAEFIRDPATGLGVRVVYDYDRASKSDVINLDLLCGAVVADPRLGAQVVKGV